MGSELLPRYSRWLFPQMAGVRVCSAQPAWALAWRDEQGQLLSLLLTPEAGLRDPDLPKDGPQRACTSLSGADSWPDRARLVAPADATLSVRLGTGRGP